MISLISSQSHRLAAQEFLEGEEWVVDTYSKDGEHKVLAIWRYDKGEANGAPFVYFGIEPMGLAGSRAREVAEYALAVLEAMQWRWGPVHMEVMYVEGPATATDAAASATAAADAADADTAASRGPVLVEANMGRLNGEEFKFLAEVVYGVSLYDAQFAVLLGDEKAWAELPPLPPTELRGAGRLVKLVSSVAGTLREVRHLDTIDELPSLARVKLEVDEAGEHLEKTVDLNSCAGDVVLLHSDRAVVEADYEALRALQPTMFEVEEAVEAEAAEAAASASMPPGGGSATGGASPAARSLRLEAEEAMRLVRLILAEHPALGAAPVALVARFPLLDADYEVLVHPGSRVACEYAELPPRKLGEALLRAVRTARDEADARRNCETLMLPAAGATTS